LFPGPRPTFPKKFHQNPFTTFSNLADRQTDRQTDTGEKHNLLPSAEVTVIIIVVVVAAAAAAAEQLIGKATQNTQKRKQHVTTRAHPELLHVIKGKKTFYFALILHNKRGSFIIESSSQLWQQVRLSFMPKLKVTMRYLYKIPRGGATLIASYDCASKKIDFY